MSEEKDITLKDLTQAALGGSEFGSLQIMLFHSVINLTLKKLDCENEKVTLTGYPAECIRQLLEQSNPPVSLVDEQSIKNILKDYKKYDNLEEKITKLECQLDAHLAEQGLNSESDIARPTKCEIEEEKDEEIASLRKNKWFTEKLYRTLTIPFTCRFKRLELNLYKLSNKMEQFKRECDSALENLIKMDDFHGPYFELQLRIMESYEDFRMTICEIQGKFDLKADNCDIVKLKKEILEIIDMSERNAKAAVYMETKPRALAAFVSIDADGTNPSKNIIPAELSLEANKNVCCCYAYKQPGEEQTLLERIKNIDPKKVSLKSHQSVTTISVNVLN